jgi:hypothetical protein
LPSPANAPASQLLMSLLARFLRIIIRQTGRKAEIERESHDLSHSSSHHTSNKQEQTPSTQYAQISSSKRQLPLPPSLDSENPSHSPLPMIHISPSLPSSLPTLFKLHKNQSHHTKYDSASANHPPFLNQITSAYALLKHPNHIQTKRNNPSTLQTDK